MARGKHATKAGNRLAQLDSEIVQSLKSEVAELNEELSRARLEVQAVQRRIYSDAQRIGNEMSRDAVAAMRERLQDGEAAAVEEMRSVGEDLVDFFVELGGAPFGEELSSMMLRLKVDNFNELFANACGRLKSDTRWNRQNRRVPTHAEGRVKAASVRHGFDSAKDRRLADIAKKLGGSNE